MARLICNSIIGICFVLSFAFGWNQEAYSSFNEATAESTFSEAGATVLGLRQAPHDQQLPDQLQGHGQNARRHLEVTRADKHLLLEYEQKDWDGFSGLQYKYTSKDKNYLLAVSGTNENVMHIVDIGNLTAPRIVCTQAIGEQDEYMHDFTITPEENLGIIGFINNVYTFRLSFEEQAIEVIGKVAHPSWEQKFHLYTFAFAPDRKIAYHKLPEKNVIARINLTDPTAPQYLSGLTFESESRYGFDEFMMTSANQLIITVQYEGLIILQMDDLNFTMLSKTGLGFDNRFLTLARDENTLLVTDTLSGFIIADITDRRNVVPRGRILIPKHFWEHQLAPMRLSSDEKTAYLYTFRSRLIVVNIQDLDNPRIESVLDVGQKFIIIFDFQWVIELTKSRYRLYDISRLYLTQEDTIPNLVEQHRPISFSEVSFPEFKAFYHHNYFQLFQDLNLLIFVEQAVHSHSTVGFYDTSRRMDAPDFLGSFQLNEQLGKTTPFMFFEVNKSKTRLYFFTFFSLDDHIEFRIADISNLEAVTILDKANLTMTHSKGLYSKAVGQPKLTQDESTVIVPVLWDSLQAFNVENDVITLAGVVKQENMDRIYGKIDIQKRGDRELLFSLSTFGLTIFDITAPFQFRNESRTPLENSGGNFTFVGEEELLISGGDRGIFMLSVSNISQPSNLTVFFPGQEFAILDFILFDDQIVVFGEKKTVLYKRLPNNTYAELGQTSGDLIQHIYHIKGSRSFIGQFRGAGAQKYIRIGSFSIPNVVYVDSGQEERLELGDDFKTLSIYPLRAQAESAIGGKTLYSDIWEEVRIISLRQFLKYENGAHSDPFPKWITADPANSRMLLDLTIPEALGTQFILARLSFKVPDDAFLGLPRIDDNFKSKRLKQTLMQMGYIDGDSFNTGFDQSTRLEIVKEFSPNEGVVSKSRVVNITNEEFYDHLLSLEMLLPGNETHATLNPTYSKEALFLSILFVNVETDAYSVLIDYFQEIEDDMLEPKIKELLNSFYMELIGEFTIHESLEVTLSDRISVSTKSSDLMTLTLSFVDQDPLCGQFLASDSWVITENSTKIQTTANFYDVNDALMRERIHYHNESAACAGELIVDDMLNPVRVVHIPDLKTVFALNRAPAFLQRIQHQFESQFSESRLWYQTYFEFQPKIVKEGGEDLEFSVLISGGDGEDWVPIESVDWIQIDRETGKLSGTPTEAIVFQKFRLLYRAQDEFLSASEEFALRIWPTAGFLINLAIQVGSFLAVIFGCWKYKDELYLMSCRGRYQYSRTEKGTVGFQFLLEIPIIRKELEESNPIIKFIKNKALSRKGHFKGMVAIGRKGLWIRYYFDQEGAFLGEEFLKDLKGASDALGSFTQEQEGEAMKQIGLILCSQIYDGPIKDVESRVLSLLCLDIEDSTWRFLKEIVMSLIQRVNSGLMQVPLPVHSENLKTVIGFKQKSTPSSYFGRIVMSLLKKLNMYVAQLPLPTCMPVWLKCEMDGNYIILRGTPTLDHKGESTVIRIIDVYDFVMREFEIQIDESSSGQVSTFVMEPEPVADAEFELGSQNSSHGFCRSFTQTYRMRQTLQTRKKEMRTRENDDDDASSS